MIRYDLLCDSDDEFDAWFRNSADFDDQAAKGLIECPHCASTAIRKAVMAPAVVRGRSDRAETRRALAEFAAKAREHIREKFDYVGENFAAEARKMHEGDVAHRQIWGEATPEEARSLIEDGAPVAPLPPELAPTPPRKVN